MEEPKVNDYIGKTCPFCRTEFKQGDEIVVCSDCDMPHHKDCWIENQGCTTFGCMGTIKAVDDVATSVTTRQMNYEDCHESNVSGIVYCTRCGAKNEDTSSFCSHCGNRLITAATSAQSTTYMPTNSASANQYAYVRQQRASCQQQGGYYTGYNAYQDPAVEPDLQRLIGTKTEYYIPKFQELRNQQKNTSWNWPAFLVAPYWMIYRKMYGYGASFLAATFIISLIGSGFLSLLSLGGYVAIGIFANYIYMKFLEDKSTQCKAMSEPYKSQFIIKNSGVNTTATILTVIGYTILTIMFSM